MTFPQNPLPDPYASPERWLPPGDLLKYVNPDSSSSVDGWMGGSGHWWGSGSGSSSGVGGTNSAVWGGGPNMGVVSAPYIAVLQPAGINEFKVFKTSDPRVARVEITFRDFTDGYDLINAEVGPGMMPNTVTSSTLDINHSRTCTLLPYVDTDSTAANLMSTWKGAIHVAYERNESFAPILFGGSTADKSIFRFNQVASAGTWEEDFTIEPQTYTPPSHIVSASTVYIVTKVPRVIVGFGDDPARVLSEFDGTPNTGNMHANTEPCFGVYDSALNSTTPGAGTLLMYANNGWWSLSSATSAISDAPTQTLSGINNGGFIIGDAEIAGTPLRLYYVEPLEDLGKTHMLDSNAATSGSVSAVGRIRSINIEGSDLQDLDIDLDFVIDAKKWREGIVATDGETVIWHSDQKVNLGWNRERQWASDAIVSIAGIRVIGERLFVDVRERTGSTTYLSTDEYILESNRWVPAFQRESHDTAARWPVFVRETPVIHYYDTATKTPAVNRAFWGHGVEGSDGIVEWHGSTLWPPSYNPFYSQTTGNMPRTFATSGQLDTTIYYFMEGMPKIPTDITWHGTFPSSATGSSVTITIAEQSSNSMTFTGAWAATFKDTDRWDKHYAVNRSMSTIDKLQLRVAITQGTSSPVRRSTPNAVPFTVGLYVYFDRQANIHPSAIESEAWRFRD